MNPSPTNIRKSRYTRSKELALTIREKCAAIEQAKRKRFTPWNGKDEPSFEVETPWSGRK